MKLVIGDKKHSSWSLRPWLVLKHIEASFDEILIRIHKPDSLSKIRKYSPAGRVPVLIDGKITIWDSLAICEYLAEKFPKKNLWPKNSADRARARSISNEMHAGFGDLRKNLPMDCSLKTKLKKIDAATKADIKRIQEIWSDCLKKSSGPFLFGYFTIADAMYTPVCLRFNSYGINLNPICSTYQKRILSMPVLKDWIHAGLEES